MMMSLVDIKELDIDIDHTIHQLKVIRKESSHLSILHVVLYGVCNDALTTVWQNEQ